MIFNYFISLLLIAIVCNPINVHAIAGFPDVSVNDFKGQQGVILIKKEDNSKYLAILAKKKIVIDQIQSKKQKTLSLRSKKILLAYLKNENPSLLQVELYHLIPIKYWEKDKYAYLISIINNDDVKIITVLPKVDNKGSSKLDASKSTTNKTQQTSIQAVPNINKDNISEKIDNKKKLSADELQKLYQQFISKGDTENANKIFDQLQKRIYSN